MLDLGVTPVLWLSDEKPLEKFDSCCSDVMMLVKEVTLVFAFIK